MNIPVNALPMIHILTQYWRHSSYIFFEGFYNITLLLMLCRFKYYWFCIDYKEHWTRECRVLRMCSI